MAQVMDGFTIGGIEKLVERLVPVFRDRGIDTLSAAYREDGPVRELLVAAGAPAVMLPGRVEGFDPLLPFRLARWLRASGVDVLHTHQLGPFIYGAAAARIAGVPHVHTEHSYQGYDAPRRRAVGRRMDGIAKVVAVSEEVAGWREAVLGRRCDVILNGVPVPPVASEGERARARESLGLGGDEVAVGCVARLVADKDHETLLAAFAAVRGAAPRLRLLLVGDGPDRAALEAQAQALRVSAQVRFLGSRPDVASLLPGLDLFVLSSRHEGLPLALLEAMAAGVPAVTTAVGEMPRVLARGGGRTVPPRDPVALGGAIASAALDPAWRREAGRAGRARVVEAYSMETMATAYERLYRAAGRSRRAA